MFDEEAPFIASFTDANTDTMTYDLLGRRGYVRLRTGSNGRKLRRRRGPHMPPAPIHRCETRNAPARPRANTHKWLALSSPSRLCSGR